MIKNCKKVLIALLSSAMMISLIGCGANKAANTTANNDKKSEQKTEQKSEQKAEKTAWDKVKEKGVLVIGNSPDYPPFETIDNDGNIVGFEIDVVNEVAKILGVKVEIKQMGFDTIIEAVKGSQIDLGSSGFSITPERLEAVNMTDPFFVGGQVIVTTKDSGIKSAADLKGQKVAVGNGSTCQKAAESIEGAEVMTLDDFALGFVMVKNKSIKATVADISVAKDYVNKDDSYVIVGEPLTYEKTGMVAKKGNDELTKQINDAIAKLKENGKLKELREKWQVEGLD